MPMQGRCRGTCVAPTMRATPGEQFTILCFCHKGELVRVQALHHGVPRTHCLHVLANSSAQDILSRSSCGMSSAALATLGLLACQCLQIARNNKWLSPIHRSSTQPCLTKLTAGKGLELFFPGAVVTTMLTVTPCNHTPQIWTRTSLAPCASQCWTEYVEGCRVDTACPPSSWAQTHHSARQRKRVSSHRPASPGLRQLTL